MIQNNPIHARRNTEGQEIVRITIEGRRKNGEGVSDTVEITPLQYATLLNLLDGAIENLEEQVAWKIRENLKERHDALVELVCSLDI